MEDIPGLLPADVLLKIFSYCSYTDLVKLQFVCRWWQQVSRHKHLWRDIVYKPDRISSTKEIIENLKASPELRALNLRDVRCTTVTEELVVEIAKTCPQLEQLLVCWNCLYDKFHFKMKKIKILFLDNNQDQFDFGSEGYFEHIHYYFPNIEHLDCKYNTFQAREFFAYLRKNGQSFHTLGFCCEGFPSEERILPYLSVCPNLKSLSLICLHDATKDIPVESVEHLKQITSLKLGHYLWDDFNYYLSIFRFFPNLVDLELDRYRLDNEQVLFIIAKNCTLLEKLTLSSLDMDDHSLKHISYFKKLTYLRLKNNDEITDAGVVHLQAVLELRYLDISDCYKLTPKCLFTLCSCPQLQILKFDLRNCNPPADLAASHVKNPDLHIMFYNCKDTSVLDRLRHQRLRLSLLKGFSSNPESYGDYWTGEEVYYPPGYPPLPSDFDD